MRAVMLLILAFALCGCAVQRAVVANQAQDKMIGLSKEQVLACMRREASPIFRHAKAFLAARQTEPRSTKVV
jgi:hypothetical protein